MFPRRLLRTALVFGLGLAPAAAVTAQDRDRERDRAEPPQAERREGQETRRPPRGRPDAEQQIERMNEAMRRRMEEFQRRFEPGMSGRFQSDMRLDPGQLEALFGMTDAEPQGLGLRVRPVPEVLRSHLDLPEGRGLVVDEVAEDGPAAGEIEANDILLSVGETPLEGPSDLVEALKSGEGDTLSITLMRRGEERTVEVERPRAAEAGGERFVLGVTIETPDDAIRAQLGLPEGEGVIVMEVAPDSAAAGAGVKANDILTKLGGEPIVGARELAEAVQENGGEPVELTLLRDGEETTVEVTPEKRPAPPLPSDSARPPGGLRFFGPGIMIDPETGALRPGPGGAGPPGLRRELLLPGPASPEMERRLDEVLEQLKQLREELDALKQQRPERRGRNGA